MKNVTFVILTTLFSMLPVYSAIADATQARYRLMIGKSSLDTHICGGIAIKLINEFSKELKEIFSETDIKMLLRAEEERNLFVKNKPLDVNKSRAARHYSSAQLELLATIDRTAKKTGKRQPGDHFIKVEVIDVATKKKLFEEIVNLGPEDKRGQIDPSKYIDACPGLVKKVVARLKKMPTPEKRKDGPVSPLPERFFPKR
ncbi:MAG: hypothetical protein JRJ87_14700 [Deltaproteobacteria bacterium]|nr:hypothetical protein [Deltaproteobacteria bacterium]